MTLAYQKYVLPMRRRFQALGRTVFNHPRKNRRWPQLDGLKGQAYNTAYVLMRRRMKR